MTDEPATTRLDALLHREGALALPEVLVLARGILAALREIHARGAVHRAVRPANVVVERRGVIERVRFEEAQIARAVPSPSPELHLAEVGAFAYMAPEQVRGSAVVDKRADLYALGALVFRALTGRSPFEATNALALIGLKLGRDAPTLTSVTHRAWPSEIELFVATSLRRDREERYENADAALAGLGSIALVGLA